MLENDGRRCNEKCSFRIVSSLGVKRPPHLDSDRRFHEGMLCGNDKRRVQGLVPAGDWGVPRYFLLVPQEWETQGVGKESSCDEMD